MEEMISWYCKINPTKSLLPISYWEICSVSLALNTEDGPQLILCATWPRRPAGTTIAFQFRTSKRFWYRFYVRNWNVIVVNSWPARPSCAQNQLRTVLEVWLWIVVNKTFSFNLCSVNRAIFGVTNECGVLVFIQCWKLSIWLSLSTL